MNVYFGWLPYTSIHLFRKWKLFLHAKLFHLCEHFKTWFACVCACVLFTSLLSHRNAAQSGDTACFGGRGGEKWSAARSTTGIFIFFSSTLTNTQVQMDICLEEFNLRGRWPSYRHVPYFLFPCCLEFLALTQCTLVRLNCHCGLWANICGCSWPMSSRTVLWGGPSSAVLQSCSWQK